MRFRKAGLAALAVISAGAVGLSARAPEHPAPDTQSVFTYEAEAPVAQVFDAMSLGGSRIGVSVRDVTADDVSERKLAGETGVVVTDVEDDMPAEEAGLEEGDVILEFDGERVRSTRHLTRLVQETPDGRKVPAVIWRNGSRTTLTVAPTASSRGVFSFRGFDGDGFAVTPRPPRPPRAPRAPRPPQSPRPPALEWFGGDGNFSFGFGNRRLGIGIESLSDQLAKYFGVEGGVLVTSVDEDSAAAKAGLRAGDVITKVNGDTIDDSGDLLRELQDADEKVELEIVRDKTTQTVTATLEDTTRRRSLRRVI